MHVDGEPIRLTRRKFELLRYLVANKNRVLSRDRLLARVWGYDQVIETRSVDVHVGRLRGKLRTAGQQIETVVGLGYRFVRRSTFGGRNHTSSPGRRDARPCTAMWHTPPFLNGNAREEPMRCAASSPRPGS